MQIQIDKCNGKPVDSFVNETYVQEDGGTRPSHYDVIYALRGNTQHNTLSIESDLENMPYCRDGLNRKRKDKRLSIKAYICQTTITVIINRRPWSSTDCLSFLVNLMTLSAAKIM
jgi:hypothetical protein